MTRFLRGLCAVVWFLATTWAWGYAQAQLPPLHWAWGPLYMTWMVLGCGGFALLTIWTLLAKP